MAITLLAVSVDVSDITRLSQFWSQVLEQPVSPGATDRVAAINTGNGLRLMFHQVPEGKIVPKVAHGLTISSPVPPPAAHIASS